MVEGDLREKTDGRVEVPPGGPLEDLLTKSH